MSHVESLCHSAIDLIDESIERHRKGEPADLSIALLQKVRSEVEAMRAALDPTRFRPGYARFILDWPDDHGLVGKLTELAYKYEKLRRSN